MNKVNIVVNIALCIAAVYGTTAIAQDNAAVEQPKLTHIEDVQDKDIAPWGEGIPAEFEDIISANNADSPMTCALFKMEKGEPLVYEYTYDDIKILLEGTMTISDGHTTVQAKEGDVLFFPEGSTITFSSDDYGLGWACGNR